MPTSFGSGTDSKPVSRGFDSFRRCRTTEYRNAVVVNSADTSVFQTEAEGSMPSGRSQECGSSPTGRGTWLRAMTVGVRLPGSARPGSPTEEATRSERVQSRFESWLGHGTTQLHRGTRRRAGDPCKIALEGSTPSSSTRPVAQPGESVRLIRGRSQVQILAGRPAEATSSVLSWSPSGTPMSS